jgi:hypothetical protein
VRHSQPERAPQALFARNALNKAASDRLGRVEKWDAIHHANQDHVPRVRLPVHQLCLRATPATGLIRVVFIFIPFDVTIAIVVITLVRPIQAVQYQVYFQGGSIIFNGPTSRSEVAVGPAAAAKPNGNHRVRDVLELYRRLEVEFHGLSDGLASVLER